jgi:Ti-type conjugative transfer relaxase TraA
MLSISTKRGATAKDAAGVASYPDESKSKAVGSIEDYYSQGNAKTPSVWMGSAAAELGLSGPVNREDHMRTLQGLDPRSGQGLVQGSGASRKYAVDLTFSAPKSVSIAWAIGGEETRAGIETAQTRAVAKVLEHIEQNFPMARRGSSSRGTIQQEKAKLLAAAFLHGSSRDLDPQIHTHLMLQNLCQREDGTWGALTEKQIYDWKLALGAVYRAELSQNMKGLGFKIEEDRDYFRLTGIPLELEEEFSKRRAEIEAALAEKGLSGAKASEIAALDTRAKKEVLDTAILQGQWEKIAGEHGVTKESIEALKAHEKEIAPGAISLTPEERAEILKKMTAMEAVFEERDLYKEVGIVLSHQGRGLEDVKQEVAAIKRDKEILKLRGQDGKQYFTTKEMLALERGILTRAREGKDDRSHILPEKTVQEAIGRFEREKGFSLSDEQKGSISHMTQTPGRIKIVQGHAGAGKSTALIPVRYALAAEGREVIGAALQGKTAKGLEESTGIKSQTIASLLGNLEGYDREDGTRADPTRKLSSKSVVIIDEAAMVDTRTLARLQSLTHEAGAELLLVGDERQVPPVQAGSPFRSLKKELGCAELTENRRQKVDWQKEASREIREGKVAEALTRYAEAGMLTIAKDRDAAMSATVEKWAQDFNPEKAGASLLTAFRKVDAAELNARARAAMQEKGLLNGIRCEVQTSTGIKEFQAGDRIFFSKNSKSLGVMNGETGTLKEIAQDSNEEWLFHVKMDDGKALSFDPLQYDHIQHGYATTINKSQGATASGTHNYIGFQGLEQLYVQLTRQVEMAHITITEDQITRAADAAGLDLAPTDKMLDYAETLAEKYGLALPEGIESDFDLCRGFLNDHAPKKMGDQKQEELDFGLEKVRSLIGSIRSREKMNALDFNIEEPEKEKGEDREITNHDSGDEKSRNPERERFQHREIERDGLSLGF